MVWLLVGCTEFTNSTTTGVTVHRGAGWTREWLVGDTDTLAIEIALPDSVSVTGLNVTWRSTDPSVLEVSELPPESGANGKDSLEVQLKAVAIALTRGTVEVQVSVDQGGPFHQGELKQQIPVFERWVAASAGVDHTCGVTIRRDAYCWGAPDNGLGLGTGTSAGALVPATVFGGLKFSTVSAGRDHACGLLLATGLAYCWGFNVWGPVGNNTQFDQLTAVPVLVGRTFRSITAGLFYTCGATPGDVVYCWGYDRLGQLGDFAPPALRPVPDPLIACDPRGFRCALTPVPVRTTTLGPPVALTAVSAGRLWTTCGIQTNQTAVCWGVVPFLISGTEAAPPDCTNPASCIVTISTTLPFKSLSVGSDHTCGITTDNRLFCWGRNDFGQLGIGNAGVGGATPVEVTPGRSYLEVSAGREFTCGIASDSTPYCWGRNNLGQLGSTIQSPAVMPTIIPGFRFSSISAGLEHACALNAKGVAYCWGQNARGQVGDGSRINRFTPMRVSEPE